MAHEPFTTAGLESRHAERLSTARGAVGVRSFLRRLHLWLAVPLGLLLVLVSLTGSALVWRDQIERLLYPGRYAVSGDNVAFPLSRYVESGIQASGSGYWPVRLTLPQEQGSPLVVVLRGVSAEGRPSRFVTAYLDPASAKVLDLVDTGSSVMGTVHSIHHMLSLPQLNGRQIVGWLGVVLVALAASGLLLWWPRSNRLDHAFRWRRSSQTTYNLHHMLGAVTALPLLAVCLTGVYLAFPQTSAAVMSSLAPLSGVRSHGFGAMPLPAPQQAVDEVVRRAREIVPEAGVLAVHFPNAARDHGHGHRAAPSWRVQLGASLLDHTATVQIDDVAGIAKLMPPPEAGDRAVKWIEWIHGGRRGDPIWPLLAVLSGFAPLVFFVTGIAMWLRRRRGTSWLATTMQRRTGS